MKKQSVIILTIILNLTIFAIFGSAQDAYFEQQIKAAKPPVKAVAPSPEKIGGNAPPNDMFESAETVTLTNGSVALLKTNIDATKEQNEPDHALNQGGKSVWFTLTPTQTQVVRIETTHPVTNFDTMLAVYKGNNFYNDFTRVGYSDDCASAGCGFSSVVALKLEAGTPYRIAVDGYNDGAATAAGTFVLTITASNSPVVFDNIEAAYDLGTNLAGSVAGTNHFATNQPNEPAAVNASLGGNSVWYRFRTVNRRAMTFEITNADFPVELAVYVSGVANPTFAQLTRLDENTNGDAENNGKGALNFAAVPSGYYFIQIDANNPAPNSPATGNYQLKFYQTKLSYAMRLNDDVPRSGPSLFRPSNTNWYSLQHGFNLSDPQYMKFGFATDTPVPADFDGDGLTNYAVARNLNGLKHWYIQRQDSLSYNYLQWGLSTDTAIVGDFDRDGFADPTVIRNVNGQLVWYVSKSSAGGALRAFVWGVTGDRPVVGDFDGDGATDVTIVRGEGGQLVWWILKSGGVGSPYAQSATVQFGIPTDLPAAEDFDGDGKTDIGLYRPSNGTWYIIRSKTAEIQVTPYGLAGDYPQPADMDADGKADLVVFRPSTGVWYHWSSITDNQYQISWGLPGDIPITSMARFSLPESNE
jgi:hypothetical protein